MLSNQNNMKKYIITLILICFSTTAFAWPFGKKESKPTPTPAPTVVSTKPTIQDGRELVKDIARELKTAKDENLKLKQNLTTVSNNLLEAEKRVAEVQKASDVIKEWGMQQQIEAQKYFEKYTDAVKRYHRLKLIAAVIAAAVGVLLGLQFMNFAPPPYNLLVPVGGAGIFAALVWFFL